MENWIPYLHNLVDNRNRSAMRMIPKLKQSVFITVFFFDVGSIILWPYIFVSDLLNEVKVRHTYIHVIQIRRSIRKYGKIKGVPYWYASYLWEWKKAGFSYKNNKYEREAFNNETNEMYIEWEDPELWKQIKHKFT